MSWIRLIESNKKHLSRGTVFRVRGKYPYEEMVEFMIFEPAQTGTGQGVIVTTGYKAGLILVILPEESCGEGGRTVDWHWLVGNWEKWVYPDCKVSDVYMLENYVCPV